MSLSLAYPGTSYCNGGLPPAAIVAGVLLSFKYCVLKQLIFPFSVLFIVSLSFTSLAILIFHHSKVNVSLFNGL